MNFFDKLPLITYDGNLCRNLLARAKLADSIRSQKEVFYPYTMDSGDRVDVVSNDYYDNPGYTWLIWMTNNHVDPYFDVALSEDDFNSFIVKKYGSVEKAARRIKYYRNNWYENDEQKISVVQYQGLTPSHKKYFEPVLGINLEVVGYKRKPDDTIVNTNKVVMLTLTNVVGTFEEGEEVQTSSTSYGIITTTGEEQIFIKDVIGNLTGNITGIQSGATAQIVNNVTITSTIADTEAVFWAPVTCLEYEQELNEQKRNIKLLDPRYAKQAENDLRRIMSSK